MIKIHFSKMLIAVFALTLTSCFSQPALEPDYWKEGETVTWKINDNFIVKATLGERQQHIPDTHCSRCENEFYRPKEIYYLGQFPINYQPKSFPKLSESGIKSMPSISIYSKGIEFYLLLNNAKVSPTDGYKLNRYNPDNPDQVIVNVKRLDVNQFTQNTKEEFEKNLKEKNFMGGKTTAETINGMKCYKTVYYDNSGSSECISKSKNPLISGFRLYSPLENNTPLEGSSQELVFGGIKVEWFTDKKNINQAQQIDEAIWRLLTAWNVSPRPINVPIQTYPNKYQQGEQVTWQIAPNLLINTQIGQMNKVEYYDTSKVQDFFLGQFPIDYKPIEITKFDAKNIQQANDINYPFKFNLVLNGAKNVPIERNSSAMPNQVKVKIEPLHKIMPNLFSHATEKVEFLKANKIIIGEKYEEFGLECYPEKYQQSSCIGKVANAHHPEVFVSKDRIYGQNHTTFQGVSVTDLYGGLKVTWEANDTDMKNWQKIDSTIWRLLDTWNIVSSSQTQTTK